MAFEGTAQPATAAETADPNAQLASAADAFKAFTTDQPVARPRDEQGRFAPTETDDNSASDDDAALAADDALADDDAGTGDDDQAADDAQLAAADMPSSWSKDDAELWQSLPPEAQARIAEREGERDKAVNQKFQEAANVRKSFETELTSANANRDRYAAAIDQVMSLVTPQQPDPRTYGAGTGNYDREAFDLAVAQYHETSQILTQLQQQRHAIAAQQQTEAEQAALAARNAIEEAWRPKFLELLPDVTDPAKAGAALTGLVEYAVRNGIEPELFRDAKAAANITSAELAILEKARRYDALKAAEGKVKTTPKPAPKPTPTARPGVATSRSAQAATQARKINDRLAREGSIDAGAAMWKNFL